LSPRQKHPAPVCRHSAYRQAFEWLDEALQKQSAVCNAEKINMVRLAMFGVVAESENPDAANIRESCPNER
jgi:hypothetical protein